MLKFLYETALGRVFLKGLTAPGLSVAVGHFLDTRASKVFIKSFVRKNGIDLNDYYADNFTCFNDCFSRRIKEDKRPFDSASEVLAAPCDGQLSVYAINEGLVIPVKQSRYTIEALLQNRELAREFEGGTCLVFRLCVDNYHRYSYFDSGKKGKNIFIPGRLHTVRPIALRNTPVFVENSREYTVMETDNFGKAVQMEVGAMLVGKIANNHEEHEFLRGEEKGCFLYGGSTIIVLLKKDVADIKEVYIINTNNEIETPVKMGETIGTKKL